MSGFNRFLAWAALGVGFSPIAAAARMIGAATSPFQQGTPPRRSRARVPKGKDGTLGYRPAAPWVPNLGNGFHWEKGHIAGPAGKGAHRRHDFKAAQKAARKAKSAKRRRAYARKNGQLFLGRQVFFDIGHGDRTVMVQSTPHSASSDFYAAAIDAVPARLDP